MNPCKDLNLNLIRNYLTWTFPSVNDMCVPDDDDDDDNDERHGARLGLQLRAYEGRSCAALYHPPNVRMATVAPGRAPGGIGSRNAAPPTTTRSDAPSRKRASRTMWELLDPEASRARKGRIGKAWEDRGCTSRWTRVKPWRMRKGSLEWARIKKRSLMWNRLIVQELGYGERFDELFADTPLLDVKCALLYVRIQRRVYIEVQRQKAAEQVKMGRLVKVMYGTRRTRQTWLGKRCKAGGTTQVLHPLVYDNNER